MTWFKGSWRIAFVSCRWFLLILPLALGACETGGVSEPVLANSFSLRAGGRSGAAARFTGSLDLVWPGGEGAGAPDEARISQAEIAAFADVSSGNPGPGSFFYRVLSLDGVQHREIGVELTWVGLENQTDSPGEIRFLGVVVSDTKPCGGSEHGSEGGCGEENGGCSHDDGTTHDDGGCSDDDGGCSHDDGSTHDDSGCAGSGGSGGHGEPGGPGGPDGKVNGADCRVEQFVIGWAKDGGTPAVAGDRISWKWMAPDAPKVLAIQQSIADGLVIPWPCKLCEKEIMGGNLRLHLGKQ